MGPEHAGCGAARPAERAFGRDGDRTSAGTAHPGAGDAGGRGGGAAGKLRRAALRRRTARSCPAAEGVAAGLGAVRPGGGGGGGAAAGHGLLLGRDGEHGAAGSHAVRALRSMAVLFGAGEPAPVL